MTELLAIHWNVDPVFFRLGPLQVRWYGLLFISGFVLGWYIFRWFFRREGIKEELLDPLLYTLLICTIVGARLGHCLFYEPSYYLAPFFSNPDPRIAQYGMSNWQAFWEIFMPWKGGLASHGGAIALLFGMWWFSVKYGRKNGFDFLWIMDHLCITVAFAGCFIRLGNLFNSEIYGNVTSLPWGIIFERNNEVEPKHPTQLYEALSYLLLGLFLIWRYWKKLDSTPRGFFFGAFLLGCFGMRFLIEFIKEPQVDFENGMALNMGQLLSIPFIVAGICIMIYAYRKKVPAAASVPEPPAKKPSGPKPLSSAHSVSDN